MASQQSPRSYPQIVKALTNAKKGLDDHQAAVGIQQNTAAKVGLDRDALAGTPAGPGGVPAAVPGLKSKFTTAKAVKTDSTEVLSDAKEAGRVLARACVFVLKPHLGDEWNSAWNAAGFTNGSLAIPDNPMTILQLLRDYFSQNPAHEVANADGGIACTAAACHAAAESISDAEDASAEANTAAGQAKAALDAGLRAGRKRLTGLREELAQFLGDDDDRWYLFGFDKPSDPDTPEVPENLVATPGAAGTNMLFLDCDDALRADSYRFVGKNGAGNEVFNELREESEATLTLSALASGSVLSVTVSARNDAGGESQPCAPIAATVP